MFRGRDQRLKAIAAMAAAAAEVSELDEVALAIVLQMPLDVLKRGMHDTEFLIAVVRERMPGDSEAMIDGVAATIQRKLAVLQ